METYHTEYEIIELDTSKKNFSWILEIMERKLARCFKGLETMTYEESWKKDMGYLT